MVTIECIGHIENDDNIISDYIRNIYDNDDIVGKFSDEFASIAVKCLDELLSKGDKFIISVVDNKGDILEEEYHIFNYIEGGSIYYE